MLASGREAMRGADQVSVACALPAAAERPAGAPGAAVAAAARVTLML